MYFTCKKEIDAFIFSSKICFVLLTLRFFSFQKWAIVVFLLAFHCPGSYAPLPPCTPFLFVNKLVESNNWSSDMNPYYPVRPCPYEDPRKAPLNLQFVLFSGPKKLMEHLTTELSWFMKTGLPRAVRMLTGKEKFLVNENIFNEGYNRHYTGTERVQHFGRNTFKSKKYYKK